MEGAGFVLTVVAAEVVPVHPLAFVTVTENVLAVDVVMHCVVAPVFHK